MLSVAMRVPSTARHLPRSGDHASSKLTPTIRAELVQLNTRLLALEREQRVQFERIAQIQQQLDELAGLVRKLIGENSRAR